MSCDLEKSKIEVVRDALKDATDTIRAQDRKASYMIAIIFFLISSFILTTLYIKKDFCVYNINIGYLDNIINLLIFFPILYFFIAIILLFISYNPVSNPTEALTKEDQELGRDKFFIFHMNDKEKNSETLANNFIESTSDIKGVLKILYIEILKVSKIRERKISLIKQSSIFLFFGLMSEFTQILTFYKFSLQLFGISMLICIFYFMCRKA
jgi:hypothetical protein